MENTSNKDIVPSQAPEPLADEEQLSQRLKEAREYLGISQEFVADHLGINRAAVSAFESSKRKVSSIELKKLAKLYRRPYDYFLGRDTEKEYEDAAVSALFRATSGLSQEDRDQVLRFAQFLKHAGKLPPSQQLSGDANAPTEVENDVEK